MIFTINKITNFKHRKITVSNPQLFMSKTVSGNTIKQRNYEKNYTNFSIVFFYLDNF